MTRRATLLGLRDEATAKQQVWKLQLRFIEEGDEEEERRPGVRIDDAKAMLRNIQQAIKRREKEKRA